MIASKPGLQRAAFLQSGGALVVAFASGIGIARAADTAPAPASPSPAARSAQAEVQPATSGPTYPAVDSWLALGRDGSVTIFYGKVELGTGIETSIAQLVSDELDVPLARVRVVQGDTALTPDQGFTAGSQSLQGGSVPIRKAAAQARNTLLALAAQKLGVPVESLDTRAGAVISTTDAKTQLAYETLVAGKFDVNIPQAVKLRAPSTYKVIGKPIARVDLPGKVTGTFRYVHNVRVPNMEHARVLYPKRLGQHVEKIDTSHLGALAHRARVVRKDDFVAVVAKREWDAIRAAELVRVVWAGGEPLPPQAKLFDVVRATAATPKIAVDKGDASAVATAPNAIRHTYQWPFQSHGSIGPSCAVADVTPAGVTIWSGTQGVFPLQRTVAAMLDRKPADVHVQYVEASGCYGHNGADDAAAAAVLVSHLTGKPARVQYMRADETRWDPKGPAMVTDLAATLTDAGTIDAWTSQVWSPTHSGRPSGKAFTLLAGRLTGSEVGPLPFVGGDRNAPNNYTIPNQRITMNNQNTSVIRTSALRGLGATHNVFANESFMDELAYAAKADPLDFRMRHLADPRAKAVLQAVKPYFKPGRGVGFMQYENTDAYVAAVVDLSVDKRTGGVVLHSVWIAHDCGLIVNPDGLRNQIEGNVVQAASRALREEVTFDSNGVTSVDWVSYPIFRFKDVPAVSIVLIDRQDQPILGAGEATTTIVPATIANAIFAQSGARLRTAPFTPAAVKAALG